MAAHLVRAHATVRRITQIRIWNRARSRAERLAEQLRGDGFDALASDTVKEAVAVADIVSCATMSREPLVRGAWLQPGTHIDLVGAFTPEMRESDDELMSRAHVFVDTFEGALAEAGDILLAMRSGALRREDIRAELRDLCAGTHPGREGPEPITVFKSVGTALEDLVAAKLVHDMTSAETSPP
jgi:ornithine cyclodeaminase